VAVTLEVTPRGDRGDQDVRVVQTTGGVRLIAGTDGWLAGEERITWWMPHYVYRWIGPKLASTWTRLDGRPDANVIEVVDRALSRDWSGVS
jgi:hypothetical protein